MAAEIIGDTLGGVLRFLGRFLADIVFEVLVHGLGHAVIRFVRPGHEPGPLACTVVGLLCWALVAGGGLALYRSMTA